LPYLEAIANRILHIISPLGAHSKQNGNPDESVIGEIKRAMAELQGCRKDHALPQSTTPEAPQIAK
jgi:hypothetical protein